MFRSRFARNATYIMILILLARRSDVTSDWNAGLVSVQAGAARDGSPLTLCANENQALARAGTDDWTWWNGATLPIPTDDT